jgi:hypothetical protein
MTILNLHIKFKHLCERVHEGSMMSTRGVVNRWLQLYLLLILENFGVKLLLEYTYVIQSYMTKW